MASWIYSKPAAVSLVLLAAVLLMVDIGLGVHYNNLKDTHLTPDDTERITNELFKLQDTYKTALESIASYKKRLDSERSRQSQTNWEAEHQTKIIKDYDVLIVKMRNDIAVLRSHLPTIHNGCRYCPPGWFLMNSVCYYFAFSEDDGWKTWTKAREFCQMYGGDLAVIDSKDKQNATVTRLTHHPYTFERNIGFWIGLRDLHEEGVWKWLDQKILAEGYWNDGEPNNINNEDCAAVYPKVNFFKAWNDVGCQSTMKWICEKAPVNST